MLPCARYGKPVFTDDKDNGHPATEVRRSMAKSRTTSVAMKSSSGRSGVKKATRKRKPSQTVLTQERQRMIAEAAYYRAERRGFQSGDPVADWLAAEADLEERFTKAR